MSPDDRPLPDDVLIPFDDELDDPALAALDAELRQAGAHVRRAHGRGGRERLDRAFATDLRARLMREAAAPLPGQSAAGSGSVPTPVSTPVSTSVPADGAPRRVRGRTTPRTPTILPAPRWSILAVAAVLVVALVGLNADSLFTAPAPARVTDAAAATLERDGSRTPLETGAAIGPGDVVRVGAGGHAALAIAGGAVRLDAGAALRIDALDGGVRVAQLAGRAWHRVAVPDGTTYTVATGDLRWTALGTAFDLNREPAGGSGGERLTLVAVEHAVGLAGPDLALRVDEGRRAGVVVGAGSPQVALDEAGTDVTRDPWLLANARLDHEAGFNVGLLEAAIAIVATPTPDPAGTPVAPTQPAATASPAAGTPGPSASPTAEPVPSASAAPTVKPTPKPTAKPTPKPTAKPTPKPTAKPTARPIADLSLTGMACAGTALLDWSTYAGAGFDHYTVLRSSSPFDVQSAYPPPAPVEALDESYTTDKGKTTFADGRLKSNTFWYRALAFDTSDRTIGASMSVKLTGAGVDSIGPFDAVPVEGLVEASWSPYGGPGDCFTYYKVSWSATNPNPSYLGDNDGALPVEGRETAAATLALDPGTWYVRVEAVLSGYGTKVIVGKSNVVTVEVP